MMHPILIRTLITFLLISASSTLFAGECEKLNVNPSDLSSIETMGRVPWTVMMHFRQTEALQEDLIGDLSLAWAAQTTPKRLLWGLFKMNSQRETHYAQMRSGIPCAREIWGDRLDEPSAQFADVSPFEPDPNDVQTIANMNIDDEKKQAMLAKLQMGELYLEGHVNPIKVAGFVNMVNQIFIEEMQNSGILPSEGTPHDWSEPFLRKFGHSFLPYTTFSKVLVALARGDASRYLVTGYEDDLEKWILAQPKRSITPDTLIRASYRIHQGDVYQTILTIENVLSRYWRVDPKKRNHLEQTMRLKPFINSFGAEGDTFGSWYHFFGIMLYGYVKGGFNARVIGNFESFGSHILEGFADEKQEDYINDKGGLVGARIHRSIRKADYLHVKSNPAALSIDAYIDRNEDFSQRVNQIASQM